MEESRNDTQQIQETQRKIEKIEEGEKNMVCREIKKGHFPSGNTGRQTARRDQVCSDKGDAKF